MCRIFSSLTADQFGFQTRSVRLGGHVTSIRLEAMFWGVLEEIAGREGVSVGKFLSALHDEILAFERNRQNFASLLRCACLTHLRQGAESAAQLAPIKAVAPARGGSSPRAMLSLQRPD